MLNGCFNHKRMLRFDLSSHKKKYSGQTVIIKRCMALSNSLTQYFLINNGIVYISDPYALLGIRRGASEAEIRKAYVKVKTYPPFSRFYIHYFIHRKSKKTTQT